MRTTPAAIPLAADFPIQALLAAKAGQRIAVILPALNEEATVGGIVAQIKSALVDDAPLVDELVVLDSGSSDATSAVAAAAGATVIHRDDVLPGIPAVTGKGEAMWRALAATHSELVVFIDADLRSFTPSYVTGLLGPLLLGVPPHRPGAPASHDAARLRTENVQPEAVRPEAVRPEAVRPEAVQMVKAVYERPLITEDSIVPAGGGRVTELVARPLLNLHWPQLASIVQPLGGEYAARRSLLESVAFPCGYGVEFALLVDTASRFGAEAIAQVDLGVRIHRNSDDQKLGRMAFEIMQAATARLPGSGASGGPELSTTLSQFDRTSTGYEMRTHEVSVIERPPLASLGREGLGPDDLGLATGDGP